MKKIIFYLLIATNYFSLGVDSVTNENLVSLLIVIGLLLIGIFITHSKQIKFSHNLLFYCSVFLIYPSVLWLNSDSSKGSFKEVLDVIVDVENATNKAPSTGFMMVMLSLIFLAFLIFMVKKFSLSREVLWLVLLIISLNKSLFSLYIFVNRYVIDNIIFHGICYLLLITTNKSFKFVKKLRVKKVKNLE